MVRSTRAGLCAAPGHGPLNQRHGRRLPKRNHPAGATAATNVRDLRDRTRATSLPAADGDRTPTEFPIADSLLMIQLARNIRMARRSASYCADTHVGGAA
jgi:hypothetical protein